MKSILIDSNFQRKSFTKNFEELVSHQIFLKKKLIKYISISSVCVVQLKSSRQLSSAVELLRIQPIELERKFTFKVLIEYEQAGIQYTYFFKCILAFLTSSLSPPGSPLYLCFVRKFVLSSFFTRLLNVISIQA